MRGLERPSLPLPVAVLGAGRLGTALAAALDAPLLRRDDALPAAGAVLLCVPDDAIAAVAERVPAGVLVGHTSGATPLGALGEREAFAVHPLMTVPRGAALIPGGHAAVAGTSERALALARALCARAGLTPFAIADADRPLYHAAASAAANFLTTIEGIAEDLGARAGVPRAALVPLVRASVEAWASLGAARALTGPVARGDEGTLARQRAAVAAAAPEHLPAWDALTVATRRLAAT